MIVKKLNDKILIVVCNEETGQMETEAISVDVWRERVRQGNTHADEIEAEKEPPQVCKNCKRKFFSGEEHYHGGDINHECKLTPREERSLAAMAKLGILLQCKDRVISIYWQEKNSLLQHEDKGWWRVDLHDLRGKLLSFAERKTLPAAILALEEDA